MRFTLRNVTRNKDFEVNLPMSPVELYDQLDKQCEYIIIESELQNISEFTSVESVNQFILDCQRDYSTDENTLKLLCSVCTYDEVINMVKNSSYFLIDFTEETSGWNSGNGGDIHNADEKGRILHQYGMQFDWERNHPIVEEMMDDIQWENLWNMAESLGWEEVRFNGKDFLLGGRI